MTTFKEVKTLSSSITKVNHPGSLATKGIITMVLTIASRKIKTIIILVTLLSLIYL